MSAEAATVSVAPTTLPPLTPYKRLDFYEERDAAIFFGREKDIGALVDLIRGHRLVQLIGASGVGKTSMLLAGVAPRLESLPSPYEVVYVRLLEDPSRTIRRALSKRLASLPAASALEPNGSPEQVASSEERALLLTLIGDSFSEDDLKDLCVGLGVDYEKLPAVGKQNKARELILDMQRRQRIAELVQACYKERPNAFSTPELRTLLRRVEQSQAPASLLDFLDKATREIGRPIVILLDQFEEFFVELNADTRAAFIQDLGSVYDARDVPVTFVLSLREDFWAQVNDFKRRIPSVFNNYERLLPLNRDQARQAITAPLAQFGMTYELALVDQLLDDLLDRQSEGMLPPQLQIVCDSLYEKARAADRSTITLADYAALGGAQKVLLTYLDEQLRHFPGLDGRLARQILEEMVTSERTKRVTTPTELSDVLGQTDATVQRVLDDLVTDRLVRVVELAGDDRRGYELAHEYLIPQIAFSEETKRRKEIEELLAHAEQDWVKFGALLPEETLALVEAYYPQLRLTAKQRDLVEASRARAARRRRARQALQGIVGGFVAALLSGAVYVVVTSPSSQVLNLAVSQSIFTAILGGAIAAGIGAGTVPDRHRRFYILLGGLLGGGLAGVYISPVYFLRIIGLGDGGRMLVGAMFGALYGVGMAVVMGAGWLARKLDWVVWIAGGGLVGWLAPTIMAIAPVGGNWAANWIQFRPLFIAVGLGLPLGIGIGRRLFQPRSLSSIARADVNGQGRDRV